MDRRAGLAMTGDLYRVIASGSGGILTLCGVSHKDWAILERLIRN
jgi:hypothetical protein